MGSRQSAEKQEEEKLITAIWVQPGVESVLRDIKNETLEFYRAFTGKQLLFRHMILCFRADRPTDPPTRFIKCHMITHAGEWVCQVEHVDMKKWQPPTLTTEARTLLNPYSMIRFFAVLQQRKSATTWNVYSLTEMLVQHVATFGGKRLVRKNCRGFAVSLTASSDAAAIAAAHANADLDAIQSDDDVIALLRRAAEGYAITVSFGKLTGEVQASCCASVS